MRERAESAEKQPVARVWIFLLALLPRPGVCVLCARPSGAVQTTKSEPACGSACPVGRLCGPHTRNAMSNTMSNFTRHAAKRPPHRGQPGERRPGAEDRDTSRPGLLYSCTVHGRAVQRTKSPPRQGPARPQAQCPAPGQAAGRQHSTLGECALSWAGARYREISRYYYASTISRCDHVIVCVCDIVRGARYRPPRAISRPLARYRHGGTISAPSQDIVSVLRYC